MIPQSRIAVGQISQETNHFVSTITEIGQFSEGGYLSVGDDVLGLGQSRTEIAGMLSILQNAEGTEVVPLLAARANSSGPLSCECYNQLKSKLLNRLTADPAVDGVLLSFHGSMSSMIEEDTEGDLISAVRETIGTAVPIVVTLDLHANVTSRMVQQATAILGYRTYPHEDVFDTGRRAAELLLRILSTNVDPVMVFAKLPLLLTAFNATTQENSPFADLVQEARLLEHEESILSTSLFYVGSYIDVKEIGCGALVVADGNREFALQNCTRLAKTFWGRREDFHVNTFSTEEAVRRGRDIHGSPVLLLDTADTTGGGAAGDGIGVVKQLLKLGIEEPSMAMVVDPRAAHRCHEAGPGAEVTVTLGHKLDPAWGEPTKLKVRVVRTLDGYFQYRGGIFGGCWADMGPSAVVQVDSVQVLIMSRATYDWGDEQYRAAGMDPESTKFVVVKNMMNFRRGYKDIMKGFFVLDLPGPTPADMRCLTFKNIQRPIYPLDKDLTDPSFQITESSHGALVRE